MANSKTIRLKANKTTQLYLQDMLRTGLYGSTLNEVAENLVRQGVLKAISDRIIGLRNQ